MTEAQLEPYQTPAHRRPLTPEERIEELERKLQQAESNIMQVQMGDDSARGGR